jgi:nuclear transport factor 2 (NTF2) superfamily protein
MARREAGINDVRINEWDRRYFSRRPASEHGHDIPLW